MKNAPGPTCIGAGRLRARFGMTIAEVLVAMTVFTLALLFVLPLIPSGLRSQRQALNRSLAVELAQAALEVDHLPPVGVTARDEGMYHLVLDVHPVDGFSPEKLLELRASVSWEERGSRLTVVQATRVCNVHY